MSAFLERYGAWLPYIAVASEVLKELDLSQSPLCQDFLAEDIGDLFNGNTFPGVVVCGSTNLRCKRAGIHQSEGDQHQNLFMKMEKAYHTMPYAPCPSSLVTL